MDDAKKIIADKIEKSTYYKDALDWYVDKYLYPITQRLYIVILSATMAYFAFIIVKISIVDQLRVKYPFPIYFNDQVKSYPQIYPISEGVENATISISRYFLSKYVDARESYDYAKLNDNDSKMSLLRKIRELSSRKIFSDYVDFINTNTNQNSPILKYKNLTKRIITVENVEFSLSNESPTNAKVFFKAVEKTKDQEISTDWVANIEFSMTSLDSILTKKIGLQFTVTKYNATEIKNL